MAIHDDFEDIFAYDRGHEFMRALDMQVALIELLKTTIYADLVTITADSDKHAQWPYALSEALGPILQTAETFSIDRDVCLDLEVAAETQPFVEAVSLDMLPALRGFTLLDRPVHVSDRHGKTISTAALAWWTGHASMPLSRKQRDEIMEMNGDDRDPGPELINPCVYIQSFTRPTDPDDDYTRELMESAEHGEKYKAVIGRYPLVPSAAPYMFPLDQAAAIEMADELDLQNFSILTSAQPPDWFEPAYASLRFVLTLWRFTTATILRTSQRPDRPTRRRAQRVLLGRTPEDIRVVRLRKEVWAKREHQEEYEGIVRTHRWWRKGHNRRIVNKKTGEVRVVRVKGHWCGPEHLPAVMKDVVYRVDR